MAIDKVTVIFIWRSKGPRVVKTMLKKNNFLKSRVTVPDIKIYCKITTIKTVHTSARVTINPVEQ